MEVGVLGFGKARRPQEPGKADLRCSFCKKSQNDVRKLIAGPDTFICDECVDVCVGILAEDAATGTSQEEPAPGSEAHARMEAERRNQEERPDSPKTLGVPAWHVRCALCDMIVATDDAFAVEKRGILCRACVEAVRAAAADADTAAGQDEGQ